MNKEEILNMTQDNPHNEMPKDTVEEMVEVIEHYSNGELIEVKTNGNTIFPAHDKEVEDRATNMFKMIVNTVETPDHLMQLCIRFVKSRNDEVTTAYKAGQASRDQEVEDLIMEIKEMGEYDT